MASFRKRNDLLQVQVRSLHAGATSKSFHRKSDAERWARDQEPKLDNGTFESPIMKKQSDSATKTSQLWILIGVGNIVDVGR